MKPSGAPWEHCWPRRWRRTPCGQAGRDAGQKPLASCCVPGPPMGLHGDNDKAPPVTCLTGSSLPHMLFCHLGFPPSMGYYNTHFKDEKTEDCREEVAFPRSTNREEIEPGFKPGLATEFWLFPFHCLAAAQTMLLREFHLGVLLPSYRGAFRLVVWKLTCQEKQSINPLSWLSPGQKTEQSGETPPLLGEGSLYLARDGRGCASHVPGPWVRVCEQTVCRLRLRVCFPVR